MKNKIKFGAVAVAILLLVWASSWVGAQIEKEDKGTIRGDKLKEIVKDIEEIHCKMTDEELRNQKLTEEDIRRVREFCSLPTEEKERNLEKEFRKIKELRGKKCDKEGKVLNYNNTYTCYWDGFNYGIPNYADLGLSSSTCSWHDAEPTACKVEGGVACLWGCTNVDSVLGWHTKWFESRTALENEILPKGYVRLSDAYGGDYGRSISYGYRWQVHATADVDPNTGRGTWHNEGPEPDPAFNWYAYLRGWWPVEVSVWHDTC